MLVYKNVTGSFVLPVDPNWKNIPLQEIRLECNTLLTPVDIDLPNLDDLEGFWNVKIYVMDVSNNASVNPITIYTYGSQTIDFSPNLNVRIMDNGGTILLAVGNNQSWISLESQGIDSFLTLKTNLKDAQLSMCGSSPIQLLPSVADSYYVWNAQLLKPTTSSATLGLVNGWWIGDSALVSGSLIDKDFVNQAGDRVVLCSNTNPYVVNASNQATAFSTTMGQPVNFTTFNGNDPTLFTGALSLTLRYRIFNMNF